MELSSFGFFPHKSRKWHSIFPVRKISTFIERLIYFHVYLFHVIAKVNGHSSEPRVLFWFGLFFLASLAFHLLFPLLQQSLSLILVYRVILFQNPILLAGTVSLTTSPFLSLEAISTSLGTVHLPGVWTTSYLSIFLLESWT